jgi:hypothetical protein
VFLAGDGQGNPRKMLKMACSFKNPSSRKESARGVLVVPGVTNLTTSTSGGFPMHTANMSKLRSAFLDYYQDDEADELMGHLEARRKVDPHIFEHEARAAELMEDDDEDAAWIHELLGRNIRRAARGAN